MRLIKETINKKICNKKNRMYLCNKKIDFYVFDRVYLFICLKMKLKNK